MKNLDSYELLNEFPVNIFHSGGNQKLDQIYLVERLITGILSQEKPSIRRIHQELLVGANLKTFYSYIHRLAIQLLFHFSFIVQEIQNETELSMKTDWIVSLDEHLIPHTIMNMEGVDYFHSSSDGEILAHSIVSAHYFRHGIGYPVSFQFYRRERKLEKRGTPEKYQKKNDISRNPLEYICKMMNSPKYILMDSYFMTKKNCQLL